MFSRQLPLSQLIDMCRKLRHYLSAGLTVLETFGHLSKKGPQAVRELSGRVVDRLKKGKGFREAIEPEEPRLGVLFTSLVSVGEETGNLPEVFQELEEYFVLQKRLRNQFIAASFWPVLQFVAATFVIAGMLFVLGLLAPAGGKPFDPLGLGLTGPTGALIFLGIVWGTIALLYISFRILKRLCRNNGAVDLFLLGVPAIGGCLRALALSRYCLAQRLTLETGMPITHAVRMSLRATGNAAFVARTDRVIPALRKGEDFTEAIGRTRLFPEEFLHVIAVGEESGRLTDVLDHEAKHYQDEAGRRMTYLTILAGFAVWGLVAIMIIVVIFRIFMSYIALLDSLSS